MAPFIKPPAHLSASIQSQILVTVVADAVGEKILDKKKHDIIPEFQLAVDDLIKSRIQEVTQHIDTQMTALNERTPELKRLRSEPISTPLTELNYPPVTAPTVSLPDNNPTKNIDNYEEAYFSQDIITKLNEAVNSLEFASVNGRDVLSFGKDYKYSGSPSNNAKQIPEVFQDIIDKIHADPDYEGAKLNQIVLNKYSGDAHLPEHSDDEPVIRPHSQIFTIRYSWPNCPHCFHRQNNQGGSEYRAC